MAGPNDDFEEVHGLLFKAEERYGSVFATVVYTVHADVAEEANRRFVDWRFAHGSGFGMVREAGGEWRRPPREDFYRSFEDTEQTVHLWHERPNRWREEWRTQDGSMLRCVVFGGARGPRWVYEPPGTAIHDAALSEPWPHQDPYTDLSFMLDTSEDLFSYALIDDATVHKTGRRTTVAGREAVEVRVVTVSWGSRRPSSMVTALRWKGLPTTCSWWTGRSGRYCVWRRGSTMWSSALRRLRRSPTTRSSQRTPSG